MIHTRFKTSKRVASFLGAVALVSIGSVFGSRGINSHGLKPNAPEAGVGAAAPVHLASFQSDAKGPADSQQHLIKPAILKGLANDRLKPVPGAKPGSYEEMSRLITREQFDALTPDLRKLGRDFLMRSRRGEEVPEACFAPGTPTARVRAFAALQAALPEKADFRDFGIWTSTATNPSVTKNRPFTLTWNIVPDGTLEGTEASDLQAFVTSVYGSEENFRKILRAMYARYSQLTGITYQEVTYDDGADYGAPGVLGVRADIRVGGHNIDGPYNVLAYNYNPNSGDMIIDTKDTYYSDDTSHEGAANMLAHEHGHGLGFAHTCPINETKLMEPTLSTRFKGPQLDDILNAQFKYGDGNEKGSLNDTTSTATPLGTLTYNSTSDLKELSISGPSDADVFSFTPDNLDRSVDLELAPVGPGYLEGAQNDDGSCSAGTPFNPSNIRNLNIQVLNPQGNVIATGASQAAGGTEKITSIDLPENGTYFIKVLSPDTTDTVQGYSLKVHIGFRTNRLPEINDLHFTPRRPGTNDKLSIKYTVSDPDEGDSVTSSAVWSNSGRVITATNNTVDLSQPGNGDDGDIITVTVTAIDSKKGKTTQTISVTIRPPNVKPVLSGGSYTIKENKVLSAALEATDANSKDLNAEEILTYKVTKKTTNGTVAMATDGTFTYTPKTNFHGTDSFTVRVSDQEGAYADATFKIEVTPVNNKPVAGDDVINIKEDTVFNIPASLLLKNDTNGEAKGEEDALKITAVSPAKNFPGTLKLDVAKQTILMTPTLNWNGQTTFNYTVQDSAKNAAVGKVTVNIAPVNDAPTAQALSLTTIANTPAEIELVGSDAEGDVASFSVAAEPSHGKAKIVQVGGKWVLRYSPSDDYVGTDSLTYSARDGYLSSVPAKISITVVSNNAPTIVSLSPNSGKFKQGATVVFNQKVNDKDGTKHLDAVSLVVSSEASKAVAKNGVALWFDAQNNVFTISTDDGKTLYTPVALGKSIYNSQVVVSLGKNDVVRSTDGTLILKWHITFKNDFVGAKSLWSRVEDLGGASAGYTYNGTITIGATTPTSSNDS